ncbi:FAD/NAD(P)-binding protein [Chloroflexota bacterium]
MKNPYLPVPMKIEKIVVETADRTIKTFSLSFVNKEDEASFQYIPGQFAEVSVLGKGEAPFGMASSPTQPGRLEFSVSRIGLVTSALHSLDVGEKVGVRGPLGNGYPLKQLKGKNITMIGGGFGFSTLRALTNYILDDKNRKDFGDVTVIYGARMPGLLLYKEDLQQWQKRADLNLCLTVDQADDEWTGRCGVVPKVAQDVAPKPDNAYALVCGPPVMIKYTLPVMEKLGFSTKHVLLSLEMRMKCGLGMCGRCNLGSKYVCRDGPVFTLAELAGLTDEL